MRRRNFDSDAAIREEPVPHDLRLLLNSIEGEGFSLLEPVSVATEWMPH